MIARIMFLQAKPDRHEEGAKMWDEEVAPILKKQKGFLRAFRVQDHESPEGIVIEFWESREAENAWRDTRDHEELVSKLRPLANELPLDRPFDLVNEIHAETG